MTTLLFLDIQKPRVELQRQTCHCGSYKFPHRRGGGSCEGAEYYCSGCGSAAMGRWVDFGIGCYEYAGAPGIDRNDCFVSECCETNLMSWTGQEIDPKAP